MTKIILDVQLNWKGNDFENWFYLEIDKKLIESDTYREKIFKYLASRIKDEELICSISHENYEFTESEFKRMIEKTTNEEPFMAIMNSSYLYPRSLRILFIREEQIIRL